MSVFSKPLEMKRDDKIDVSLSDSLLLIVKELLNEKTTTFSKKELKAISICTKNCYIADFISNYIPNKRLEKNHYEKRLEKALDKICGAISTRIDFSNLENPNGIMRRFAGLRK